jgi:hypothetical protein
MDCTTSLGVMVIGSHGAAAVDCAEMKEVFAIELHAFSSQNKREA